jgi:hypothetical protein
MYYVFIFGVLLVVCMVKLVWSLRLESWVVQGLSEIPQSRKKVRLFCEGLVAVDRKARGLAGEDVPKIPEDVQVGSQKVYQKKGGGSENSFGKNFNKFDVLQSDLDSIEEIREECVHDWKMEETQVLTLDSHEVVMKCSQCGATKTVKVKPV